MDVLDAVGGKSDEISRNALSWIGPGLSTETFLLYESFCVVNSKYSILGGFVTNVYM